MPRMGYRILPRKSHVKSSYNWETGKKMGEMFPTE